MASTDTTELCEREQSLVDRERALTDRIKAIDDREKEVARRENSFDQEWAELVDEQAEFYKTGPGLTTLAITEKKQKLQLKKEQLKRLQGLLKAWERDLRLGIVYPCYTNPYTCKYCGTDIWRNERVTNPSKDIDISSLDEFSD
jgi:uncharacterized protein (DUF3084 family)